MSDSPNIALIRRLYESGMSPEATAEIMAPDLVWDITPGFPNSGVYHGWDSAAKDFFGGMMKLRHPVVGELTLDWDTLTCATDPEQHIIVWTAAPGSPSYDGLRLLASWAADQKRTASGSFG